MAQEEVVTVPADVQVGGKFEHTFASGKTVQVTVPYGAGPGYRLTLDEKRMVEWKPPYVNKLQEDKGTSTHFACCGCFWMRRKPNIHSTLAPDVAH